MKIEQALISIMGYELYRAIVETQGLHWAVVAAMAEATTDDDPRAIAAIRAYNEEQKAANELRDRPL